MNYKDTNILTAFAMEQSLLATGCASSGDQPAAPGTSEFATAGQIEGDPNRMVCKRDNDTGSRLSKRICKTAAEWERERLESQEAMRNATKSPTAPSSLPSAGGG